MPDSNARPADKQLIALTRFNARLRAHLKSLITDALIEEHRQQPLGQHSDDLERVLNFFRRPPRFGLYSKHACTSYQVIALPVPAGASPEPIDAQVYTDQNAAMHAVFLHHVAALRAE